MEDEWLEGLTAFPKSPQLKVGHPRRIETVEERLIFLNKEVARLTNEIERLKSLGVLIFENDKELALANHELGSPMRG